MTSNSRSLNLSTFSRRRFLRYASGGALAGSVSGWLDVLAAGAATGAGRRHKSCIVLFMSGGPSHIETVDLKLDAPAEIRGPFKPIDTAVPDIKISENFPRFAKLTRHAAIIRSMTTTAGAHAGARYHVHTGKLQGGLEMPSIGSLVAKELGRPDFPMPNYVSLGPFHCGSNDRYDYFGSGFLGPRYQPLVIKDPQRGVENLKPLGDFTGRLGLLDELQQGFYKTYRAPIIQAQQTTVERTVRLMKCRQIEALDLSREPASAREAYGNTEFGDSCLVARRLVEIGVPFVEVGLGGWDTHGFTRDPIGQTKSRSVEADAAISALVNDLLERGLLDSTLIVWMGEFGRSPKASDNGGRSHWPQAWSTMLVGGGIQGGAVIGRTDKIGGAVEERPVPIQDFLATICKILGIDYTRQNTTPGGRPVPIVDNPDPKPIAGLV